MNETFAKILVIVVCFWLGLIFLTNVFAERLGGYLLDDKAVSNLKAGNSISILWEVMTFQVSGEVPFFVSVVLDLIAVLSVIMILFAVFNR